MNEIIYKGPFKDHIQNHVALKQAVGYKYETDAAHLKRFDQIYIGKISRCHCSYKGNRIGLVQ